MEALYLVDKGENLGLKEQDFSTIQSGMALEWHLLLLPA